jgi:hypothetical protein
MRFIRSHADVTVLALTMGVAVYAARLGLEHEMVPQALKLFLLTLLGVIVYLALVAAFARGVIVEVRENVGDSSFLAAAADVEHPRSSVRSRFGHRRLDVIRDLAKR